MIDGIASDPFSAKGLPPLTKHEGNTDKIIRVSRERYGTPKAEVEDKIARWASSKDEVANNQSNNKNGQKNQENGSKNNNSKTTFKNEKDGFEATCSYCGIDTSTSFKPDGIRPIFCKDCLVKMKNKDLIIEKNHKGEYVVIKEPGKKDEDWGVSLDSLKSGGNSSLEELKKKLEFKSKEDANLPVVKEKVSDKKPNSNKVPTINSKQRNKPASINDQKNKPVIKKDVSKRNDTLKPGQKIEF